MSVRPTGPRSLLAGGALVSAAALVSTGTNYALNLLLAGRLDPAAFGDANLAINLVLVVGVAAATLQLTTATLVSRRPADGAAVVRVLARLALGAGAVLMVGLAALSAPLASVLHTSTSWMFVALAVTLPVFLLQAVHRGALQGARRLGRLSFSYGAEASVRLVVTLALVAAGRGVIGVCAGITVALVASGLVVRPQRSSARAAEASVPWSALRSAATSALVLLAAQVLFLNADLLLSKARFAPENAGSYAAAALIGRGVFFVSWSIAQSMLPAVADPAATRRGRRRAELTVLAVIAVLAVAASLTAQALSGGLAAAVLPPGYAPAAPLLLPHAVAGSLFALANVLAALDLATGRREGPRLLVAGAALQLVLLLAADSSVEGMAVLHVVAAGITLTLVAGDRHFRARPRCDPHLVPPTHSIPSPRRNAR